MADNATALNAQGFTNVQADRYWSCSSYAGDPASAWIAIMIDGDVDTINKTFPLPVWPVRAGQ